MATRKNSAPIEFDYRTGEPPSWAKNLIAEHLAMDEEDAKSAGTISYMARALIIATMPYKDPKDDVFMRKNGDFTLRIVAGYEGGIPFGIYPRLLMSWVTTEAFLTGNPNLELGDSLSRFLKDVLERRSTSGGERGTGTRASEQMKRLFGALITAQYKGSSSNPGFRLRNVMVADDLDLSPEDEKLFDGETLEQLSPNNENGGSAPESELWTPQSQQEAGQWKSSVRLSNKFFQECVNNPVPLDQRAYMALAKEKSPMAMDIYTWLTYKMFSLKRVTRPIPFAALMGQFGANFASSENDPTQAVRNFAKQFILNLKKVQVVYPDANFRVEDKGLVLLPSKTHVPPLGKASQTKLF